MKLKILLFFIIFIQYAAVFSQETDQNSSYKILLENKQGHLIQTVSEQNEFLKTRQEKREKEIQNLKKANLNLKTASTQTSVEICTNGGFEQLETVSGSSSIKNFLYTIGDPPGPTQCRSISNTADSNINSYNPNNLNIMATGVPSNLIDPYIGDIKAFDQYALKINHENSSTYGSIVQGKRFKTNNENYLKFNYKAVLQSVYDNSHTDNQAFTKARIINKNGVVVSEFCLVGDEKNCIFTKAPSQSSGYVTLYTNNWQSGILDISSIPNNEEFTVEFMASRCGLGGHFGYMYVDDICILHSSENFQGSIDLEPLNKVCPSLPVTVCGNYTVPNSGGISASVKKITLNVYDSNNISVYSTSTTSSLDTTNKKFCFTLNATDFPNSINANYNVGVKIEYDILGTSCTGTTLNSASDADANPGWDISFLNCSTSCTINLNTAKISQCDTNRDGSESFDLSKLNALVVGSTTGLSFNYFTNYNDAQANLNAILNFTNYLSSSTSLFIRVGKDATCYKIITVGLEVKNPTANITGILNVCSGSTKLTASSGATYLWNTGAVSQSIMVTSIGNYSVTVTDSFGCSSEANVAIEPSQTAVLPILQITQPSCFTATGTIKVTSDASQYSFDNGFTWSTNNTKSNLSPGTYLVKIKTINGCTSYSQSVTISAASTLYPNYTYTNPLFCGDVGTITITTPAASYSYDDGVTWVNYSTATNLFPGNYKIRTKDLQGCISSANNVLIVSNSLETPTYTIIQPACSAKGSITINTVSNFYTFDGGVTWGTGNQLSNLSAGNYSVGIKNASGCTSFLTYVYLNDYQNFYPEYNTEQPVCGGNGKITIDTVADQYSFDNGITWTTNNTSNLPFGNYQIRVKNSAGCISSSQYVSLYQPYLSSPIISIEQPTCGTNGKITINSLSDFYSFDNGVTWTTLNNKSLPPGYYNIIIKNSIGCTSYPVGVYLNNPNITSPTYTVIQPTCNISGSITINTVADFYSFDGGKTWGTTASITNINTKGYYEISIKNNLDCSSNVIGIYINDPYFPDPEYTITNPSCGNIGNITFNTVADYYSIDYGATWSTNPIFNNLNAGVYYLLVKKVNCKSRTISVYLDSASLASPRLTIVQPSCGTMGSVTITTTADFYSINGQVWVTNPVFTNLTPGYYSARIKNSQGCISNYSAVNIEPFNLPNPNFSTTQPTCGTGGTITFTTTASEYSINGGATWSTNPTFTNLNSNYYNLVVKNALGCTSSPYNTQTTLNQYYLPNPDFTVIQPTCGINGSITVATVANSYSFDNGSTWTTNPTLSGLTSGYYGIIIKNATGCVSNNIFIYINPFYLPNPKVKIIQPSCGNGGSITITTPADNYSFDGGLTWTTNPVLLNPTLSSYNIIIKNTAGCKSQSQYYYINKYYLPSPNITTLQPTCSTPSGTIIINSTADQFSFDNGLTWTTDPIKKNVASGFYYIVIKNALGCVSNSSYVYVNTPPAIPPAPLVQIVQPTSCGATDGSITIKSSAISYSFNDGNSWTTNPTKTNIGEGTYIIKIKTNSYSCESSTTVVNLSSGTTISAPTYTTSQPNCNNSKGAITITTSASTYSYDNGLTYVFSNTKTDLTPGIYNVKIKSLAGCISDAATVTILPLAALPAPAYKITQPDCTNFTGSLSIETVADLYSFDNGATFGTTNTKSNLSAGTYNLMIKYNSGCISLSTPVTINAAPSIPVTPQVIVTDPIGCNASKGKIIVSTVADLYSFDDGNTWSSSNTANLSPGNYLIRIKYLNGCASIAYQATINTPPNAPSAPTVTISQPISCSSPFGSISITSTAYEYSFDNGATYSNNSISGNLVAGTYLVRVKNSSGCESVAISTTIDPPTDYPASPLFTTIQPDCNNLKGTITITNIEKEYSFDNGTTWTTNPIQTNLNPGTYYIKTKNNIGCNSNASIAVLLPFTDFTPKPLSTNSKLFCIQQNATINDIIISGQNIKWYDASTNGNLLSNTAALVNGVTYYASQTISDCESDRVPVLINIQNTSAPTGNTNQSFCSTANATLADIITTGNNIIWYNSATDTAPLTKTTLVTNNTTYYASQTINGCESVNRLAVTINLINTLNATNYSEIICDDLNDNIENINLNNYNANLISSTGNTFRYYKSYDNALNQNSSDQINNFTNYNLTLGTNTFYTRIDSPNTCFQVVTLILELVSKPVIPINDIAPICEGSFITLSGGNNYDSYTWSTGETSQEITITQPGNYSVIVTENHGTISCSSTKNFVVVNSNVATIKEIISSEWTENNNTITVLLNNSLSDYDYSLDGIDFQNSNVFNNLQAGEYTVFVRDKNGCGSVTDKVYLLMYPLFFTPNGDGYNDTWKIKFPDSEAGSIIEIFDRFGKLLTKLNTNSNGWDGNYNGQELPSSDYWFVINRLNGSKVKGHFTLKR